MRKFFTLKYALLVLVLGIFHSGINAQLGLSNASNSAIINFSNSMQTSVGTNPSTAYTGSGFSADPTTAGRLNSNAWAVTGWSDGALAFGGSNIAGDYARGTPSVAVTTGGMYAFTGAPATVANPMLLIQPGGGDFAPGTITLRIKNKGNTNITQLDISYNLYVRNDQLRSNSFNFSYSGDNTTYTPVAALDYTSVAASDALGLVLVPGSGGGAPSRTTTITGLNIAPGAFYYIRWSSADAGGSGSRDEFGLDDISVGATFVLSSDANLSSLSASGGTISFSPGTVSYSFGVSNAVSTTTVNATANDAFATVSINGNPATTESAVANIPLSVGANTINTVVTAPDLTTKTYSITINRAVPATPVLSLGSSLADFGSICTGNASAPNSFAINGNDLDGTDISIAALPGFSYADNAGGPYSSTLSFTASTVLSGKIIYVQFNPAAVQSYDGNILVSGGGSASLSVPVTGSGVNTTASVVTGGNIVAGITASLNGSITAIGCSAVTTYGFEYSTTPGFVNGTGIQVAAVNLNSGGFSKTVSGLVAGTTYYYKAFAVNNGGTGYGAQNSFTTSSVVPVVMSAQPLLRYTENFNDIANWSNNFITGIGANHFSGIASNGTGSAGNPTPNPTLITASSTSFSSGTSGGVQKGTGNIVLFSTGATDNTSSVAIDFYMDFTGVNAGALSFDWNILNNGTGGRTGSLRVYASNDGTNFTELTSADVLNFINNVPATGTVSSIALPASFNNSPTARLRFYYHNGTGGASGSRPKISIDNLIVTAVASSPCATPSAAPGSLTFGTITETTIQGSFVAPGSAPNEYLVVMSESSSLTSNPIDGQTYVVGDNLGDGTVIAKGSELNFTATDLTGATTYYFFVFPVNSVCTGGPKYLTTDPLTEDATTVAGLPSCTAPAAQPTGLTTVASINSIQGSFTATAADEYLVLQSTSTSLSNLPVNGVVYNAGAVLGNATVITRSNAVSFTASGLNPATQYYYYVFGINSQACVNGPVYNAVSPLSGSETTLPLPVCVTPSAQPANISFNSSNNSITATFNAAGSGYNYLVVMSSSSTLSGTPVDNTDYAVGSSLGGGTVISNNTATSFIATSLNNSTTYYFFVFSANKNCTGGTKYMVASPLTGNATTTNAPVNNYYFGTLHSHSDYSDGNKDHPGFTPADDYNYASASLGMDFLGISEHNHFSSLNNPGNELANYHLGIAQAAAFNSTHSNFLALYGMEWGVISGGGHVLVYGDGMSELFGWESNVSGHVGPNYDVYVPKSTYLGVEGLFKTINDYVAKNAFATLAHPSNHDYNDLSNIPYDQSADDAISGVAVESGPATSTNTTYSNPGSSMFYLWYFQKLLSKGYHVGPTIDHDNHNTTFGRTTPARTAVIAPALTQSEIIKAVKDMHFYATEDVDAKVDFTINTRIMGSVFEDRNAPSIAVNLTDATTSTSGALIRLLFGIPGSNTLPVVLDSVYASSFSYVDNALANHATGYYYIDITNAGKRIITSPIWYTRTCASSSDTTATVCDSFNWYGTVYTTSTTATKVFTGVGGCDSTVTLHLTINNSPSSATISLVGSDTGCPGAGVAFTATATDASSTIASYQWLKDGNLVTTTTVGNYTALESGSYSVKAVNAGNCFVASNSINAIVADNIAPEVHTQNITVTLDASGTASITAAQVNAESTDNCLISSYSLSKTSFDCSNVGDNTVTLTVTDASGNSSSAEAVVTVNNDVSVFTAVPDQTFCYNASGSYSIPLFAASNSCGPLVITYSITGATTRTGVGNNASGSFAAGVSTIQWMQGATVVGTTNVTITALPAVTITASNADAFCNQVTLTANSTVSGVTYQWMSGSSVFDTDAQTSLGQTNGDGIYTVTVSTAGGCTSAAATYNYQKQNLLSSYTILATTKIDLGENNKVVSGSVGVTSANGKVDFDKNSSVSSPGSFVKARSIDMHGSNIIISNPIHSAATGIALPTMYSNTANTNGLPNKDVAQNSVSTVNGNYKNLTLKKGSRTTVTGNTFGTIRVEQGAQVTFTASTINIDKLDIVKGPRYGYSYIRFTNDTKILISGSVSIGSQVYINPDNKKVTFYMGDTKNDQEKFTVKGGDTKVTANIYLPVGTLKVTGGYSYGDYGNGWGDCDGDDDEEKYFGKGNSYVTMTGTFIAGQVMGNGKNVNWNSFNCGSAPVPVLNSTNTIITQMISASKEGVTNETGELLKVTVSPNPSTTYFTLKIASRDEAPVNLRVLDGSGRTVDTKSKLGANSTIQIGHNYSSGTYYVELIQGTNRKVVQLIKVRG
jgi:hypothetical protein